MGVLFYGPNLNLPSQLWMRRQLEGLRDQVSLLVDYREPAPEYSARYEVLSLGYVPITWPLLLRRLQHRRERLDHERQLTVAMRRSDVDCALIHYLVYAVKYQKVWKQVTKPVHVHCHGLDVTWDLRPHNHGWRHRFARGQGYIRQVLELPEHVSFIANSECTRRRLLAIGLNPGRIVVKYLGVPVPAGPPLRAAAHGPVMILYLGRLVDCKGPDLMIRAFTRACDQGLDARLIIAGDGPLREDCKRLRAQSRHGQRIELLGAVTAEHGAALRCEADIFTAHNQRGPQTRQEEAFGVAYVEAMAAGLPVVTGRNGSIPELIEHGREGLLFEPGDIEAHARSLLELAEDAAARQRMGLAGWRRARECFSLERENRELRAILGLPQVAAHNNDGFAASIDTNSCSISPQN